MALSQELYNQCRTTLLKCDELNSGTSLRAVFATVELSPFRDSLREADSKNDRVDYCLEHLPNQRLSDGRSVFTLFIEQLLNSRYEGDALRDELEGLLSRIRPSLEENCPIAIPFVVAAMKTGEATALIDETIFEANTVAPVERARFREFKEVLGEQAIGDLQSHYGEYREDWRPHHCQQSAIQDIIFDTLNQFNHQLTQGERPVQIPPPFFSSKFFAEDENTRIETWNQLSQTGCIIIVDAISMFHPRLNRIVSRSEMGSNNRVAILTFSPVNSIVHPVNQSIENHISLQMQRAFARFDKYLDRLCEFGLGDLRAIQRWLFATLPETMAIIQDERASPYSRRVLHERVGKPRGMDKAIFGRGSER